MADGENEGISIPKERLDREIAAKRAAQGRVGELEGKLSEMEQQHATATERAKTADTLATQLEALQAERLIERAEWDEERGIYRAGITDPDAIDVARLLHGKLPEDGRPALADWLGGLREDPAKAPRALQPYLVAPATQQATTGATGKQQSTQQAATDGQWNYERIHALTVEAAKTGDYSALKVALAEYRGANGLPQRMK